MGEGSCEVIPAQAALLRGSRAMVVTDPGVVRAGIVEKVLKHIDPQKLAVTVFDEVRPDPSVKTVDCGASVARESGSDILIAVGGGKGSLATISDLATAPEVDYTWSAMTGGDGGSSQDCSGSHGR